MILVECHLERQSDGEVEGKVATELRMDDGPMSGAAHYDGGDGLHTSIETEDEEVEIQSYTETVADGDLFVKCVPLELTARLVGIVTGIPDVTGIDEGCAFDLPEQSGAVFQREIEFEVTGLVDEVDVAIASLITAGTELSDTPAANRVGTTGEIAFLVGNDGTVAVGNGKAECSVEGYRVALVENETLGVVKVEFCVLRIGDIEEFVLPIFTTSEFEDFRSAEKQVACCFDIELHLIAIGLVEVRCRRAAEGIVDEGVSRLHDEEILIGIAEHSVTRIVALKIFMGESI